jgi:protein gp37
MENSKIAWTHHTFNPWIGCTKVSPGCTNCYAKTEDDRHLRGPESHWGVGAPRHITSASYWKAPYKWNREAQDENTRKRVFCGSLCDWADDEAPLGVRDRLWDVIRETPHLDWLLLTKRAKNIEKYLPKNWGSGYPNVWLGVSVEDHKYGFPRVDILREIPAAKRFLSCEPLLEDIGDINLTGIDWVITGGESGNGVREFDLQWARSLQLAAKHYEAAFFVKQLGSQPVENGTPFPILNPQEDGKQDKHGRSIVNFPADLQVQEIPATKTARKASATMRKPNSTVTAQTLAEVVDWLQHYADGNTAARFLAQNALISITGLIAVTRDESVVEAA